MNELSYPDTGRSWQRLIRSKWAFLILHAGFVAAWFIPSFNVLATLLPWFVLQFSVHAGYHRYFAHRSYKTHPWFELLLACSACLALQNGPLWWVSKHRHHHRSADTPDDRHSPAHGFWHAHIGWLWCNGDEIDRIDWDLVKDMRRPIPIWVERNQLALHGFYVLSVFLCGGPAGIFTFWVVPIVLCWHTTFATNSICHLVGARPYALQIPETCLARNNGVVAIANLGEGWHNNHHAYPSCCHHGFHRWYQLDITYTVLFVLEQFGIVWGLRKA